MEQRLKPMLLVVIGLFALQVIYNFFFIAPQLNSSIKKLEESQHHLDSAMQSLRDTRATVDSIEMNMAKFNNYLVNIQGQTAFLYKDRELKESHFKVRRDSILTELAILKIQIDTMDLPLLKLYDSRQH
jgi:hypothetical protein